MIAALSSGTKLVARHSTAGRPAACANTQTTASARSQCLGPFFMRISPTLPHHNSEIGLRAGLLHSLGPRRRKRYDKPYQDAESISQSVRVRDGCQAAVELCRSDLCGYGTRGGTQWVNWTSASFALLRTTGVNSRYVNARFHIFGRSTCGAAEGECESRSISGGEEGVGEGSAKEAWTKALSQYGASWSSCFDGGLATIASSM